MTESPWLIIGVALAGAVLLILRLRSHLRPEVARWLPAMAVGSAVVLAIQQWIAPSGSYVGVLASFFWGWLIGTAFQPQMVVDRRYLNHPDEKRWPLWLAIPCLLLGLLAAGWVFGVIH